MDKKLNVSPENHGYRLDKYLTGHLQIARNQVQNLIKKSLVAVNNHIVSVHHFLKAGDVVTVKDPVPPTTITRPPLPRIKILFENNDLLVINKPAGISVHPAAQSANESTLVDWLREKYPAIIEVGDDPVLRPGIVHRLDKDVSGCLLIAKTQPAFLALKSQFQDRQIKKEYLALVYGRVSKDTDKIDFPLDRGDDGIMVARPEGQAGREAVTIFDVLRRFPQYTFLKIQTLTGRMHQIRTHLKAYGHSIVGDQLYATRHQIIKEKLPQIFLHAAKIGFKDLNANWQEVSCPMPPALQEFLKTLP